MPAGEASEHPRPLVVEVVRNDQVEARHVVHAVAVRDGGIVYAAGDVQRVSFLRSSAKPIQALPLVRARPDLEDEMIAIACASHLARPEQLAAVRRLLAVAVAGAADLECGPEPTRIAHNCSGKHAGFLALCRTKGWPAEGYRLPGHPCQQAMLAEIAAAAEREPASIPTGVDGCGVVTFALPLVEAARMFARLWSLDGGERVIRAMCANPELLRGPVAADAVLIRALDGWVAKGGAEGLFCASSADGLAVAIKVEDGNFRAIRPALAAFLGRLGVDPGAIGDTAVESSRGERVGAYRVVEARLRRAAGSAPRSGDPAQTRRPRGGRPRLA